MKGFPIFRPGKHTSSSGTTLEFTPAQLKAAVLAYDPALHEAPIVVGHPQDNHPAYGWVKGLTFDEATGEVGVEPHQVMPEFDEMVGAGRFKKRSASWYLPDAPNNPKPGVLYIRHVGFLGAQPPSVKGLRDVTFAANDKGVEEFIDNARWAWGSVAAILRGIREWIISDKGLETADKLIPNFYLSDVEAASKAADDSAIAGAPAYSEGSTEMDKAAADALTAENATLKATNATQAAEIATLKASQPPANFAEMQADLQRREAAVAAAELLVQRGVVEQRVDAVIKAGRLLPNQKKSTVDFAMSLASKDATIDFGEGDKAKKVTQRDAYLLQLESAPRSVQYGELAGNDGGQPTDKVDAQALADKAAEIKKKAEADGKSMSFTEAVAAATVEMMPQA